MIYKSALIAATVLALVALATGKTIRSQRMVSLNGLKYELTRYSDDTLDVAREDGLHFGLDIRSGKLRLDSGTQTQLTDATTQLRTGFLPELAGGAP
jgi:hypothetical protein